MLEPHEFPETTMRHSIQCSDCGRFATHLYNTDENNVEVCSDCYIEY